MEVPSGMLQQYSPTELVNGIQQLAEQTRKDISREENGIIVTLQDKYRDLPALLDYFNFFGPGDLVDIVTRVWHRRFEQGLKLIYEPKSQVRVLCAFGSIADLVHTLDQSALDNLESWCLSHPLNLAHSGSGDCENSLNIPSDIVAALANAFQSAGLKPSANTYQLRNALRTDFPLSYNNLSLGGASAIIAEALTQLGVDARVYSMYHSQEQANCFDSRFGTKWLDLSGEQPVYREAHKCGKTEHPTRYTYVLTYSQGRRLASANVAARETDRSLVVLRPYFGRKGLKSFTVRDGRQSLSKGKPEGTLEWFSMPGFVSWELSGRSSDHLKIEFVPSAVINQLGREHHYVIINAPALGQLQNPKDPLTGALLQQLRELNSAGSSLHMEISGGADPQKHNIGPFVKSLKGLVLSMGVNHKELSQVASLSGYPRKAVTPPAETEPESIFERYVQALRLAQTLDLERLYVHGTDVDLILRKGAAEAALQQEVQADLFTKGAVIVSILLRNELQVTDELPRALYHEGFKALVEFGWEFSQKLYPPESAERKILFKRIVHDGYYLAPGRDEYSVAIIPVMWPESVRLQPSINTTGAGDLCSGFSLIYSGWR
jgi:ADP-dependent phosphofructokinase/glucokinase